MRVLYGNGPDGFGWYVLRTTAEGYITIDTGKVVAGPYETRREAQEARDVLR